MGGHGFPVWIHSDLFRQASWVTVLSVVRAARYATRRRGGMGCPHHTMCRGPLRGGITSRCHLEKWRGCRRLSPILHRWRTPGVQMRMRRLKGGTAGSRPTKSWIRHELWWQEWAAAVGAIGDGTAWSTCYQMGT